MENPLNEDLLMLRGRYVTLQEEHKIKQVEFHSQRDYLKKLLMFVDNNDLNTVGEHLQNSKIIINKMIELQSSLSDLSEEIRRLKPMTGF